MKFAVIGHPVSHSLSPRMHAANFRALGLEAEYGAVDVEPGRVAEAIRRFAAEGYRGINVTVPHKLEARACMDRLDATAERTGAVNTVCFAADGSTTGYNTDMAGFMRPLERRGFRIAAARVLVLGAGGAAQAIVAACRAAGCGELTWANRTLRPGLVALDSESCRAAARAADLVVNATTVGLAEDDASVLPATVFRRGQLVYDIIPCRRETATRTCARLAGAETLGGLEMLAAQGAESFRIWTGREADWPTLCAALGIQAFA